MKQLKTIVALVVGLFSFTSVQAGEMTVTGSMQATYQSEVDNITGNPLGMNTDLTFKGETDTDFGTATWTMATDGTFLGGATGNAGGNDHSLKLATSMGTFGIGNSGDAANAVDDITPTAFEEANGSGSGSYTVDFGSGMDGSMSLSYGNSDVMGTGISVAYNYYPKLNGTTNNEKAATGNVAGFEDYKHSQSLNVGIPVAGLPVVGDTLLGGIKVTLGYEKTDNTLSTVQSKEGGTVAVNLPVGPLSVGIQKKAYAPMGTTLVTDTVYRDDIYGVAYAINDDLALSYNVYESEQHQNDGSNVEQETKAINLAYTVGGLTLGFQDAKTSNSGYTATTDNDTRTISVKTAF
jgi:hypothetical protein